MPSRYPVNVKIPEEYVRLIDENLREGRSLSRAGFRGRTHVVRTAVYKFLVEHGIQPIIHPNDIGKRVD